MGGGAGAAIPPTASTAPANHGTGRERAIEALIDREPQGDFYRFARVVVSGDGECCLRVVLLFA